MIILPHSALQRIVMQETLLIFFIIINNLALICLVDQIQSGNKYLMNAHYAYGVIQAGLPKYKDTEGDFK